MSRTDIHRPGWVKERDPHLRQQHRVEHDHWHRDHWDPELKRYLVRLSVPCDLHLAHAGPGWTWTRCRYTYVGQQHQCGCKQCTGQDGRKVARRQERARWRAARQRALAEHRGGHRDIDIAPIRRKAW